MIALALLAAIVFEELWCETAALGLLPGAVGGHHRRLQPLPRV